MDAWRLTDDARQLVAQRLYGPTAQARVYSGLYLAVYVGDDVHFVPESRLGSVLSDIAAEQGRRIWDYLR